MTCSKEGLALFMVSNALNSNLYYNISHTVMATYSRLFPCKLSYPSARNLVSTEKMFVYTKNELIKLICKKKKKGGGGYFLVLRFKECHEGF